VLLIEELEEILEVLEPEQFQKLAVPVCSRIARCVSSCSSQVRIAFTQTCLRPCLFP
jgi:serine/threonine-protein phosphatase 2A regulatory subunit B'